MKRTVAVFLMVLAACIARAQSSGMEMKGMDMGKPPAAGKHTVHKATGKVERVDRERGTVTIAHGAVQSMKWPAMTMTFDASDKKMLENVRPGSVVEFEFEQQASRYTITSIH